MKLLEYDEFRMKEFQEPTSDVEDLQDIQNILGDLEEDLEKEVSQLDQHNLPSQRELQHRFKMFRKVDDLIYTSNRSARLLNYLNFIKYGYS